MIRAIIGDYRTAVSLSVLVLLKTYLDMIALREGPDAVPASWLILYLSFAMSAVAWFLGVAMIDVVGEQPLWPAIAGYVLSILFYGAVIYVFGFAERLLQAISAIIACGSILTIAFVAEYSILAPFVGTRVAGGIGTLILFWSVPVKGHIVALAIQQHWFVGITIVIAAFILQLGFESAFNVRT